MSPLNVPPTPHPPTPRLTQAFRGKGLADEAIVFLLAAMPVLELRGAIPVGVWLGLPIAKVRVRAACGKGESE